MNEEVENKYFDYNATTPLFRSARAALFESFESHWYNPSSLYPAAGRTKRLLEEARENLAQYLGVEDAERILFTSGATEANNLVLRHVAETQPGTRVLVSEIEHPSVLEPSSRLFEDRLVHIPVNKAGTLDLKSLEDHLRQVNKAGLVSVMAANNESGVLQPWAEANALCLDQGVSFHCDATQWIGKLDAARLGTCDWVSGSAHKFGGPKGLGFLVIPSGLERLNGSQSGGPQERGLRAGTENYPAITAMLVAFDKAKELAQRGPEIARDRDNFEAEILSNLPGARLCGAEAPRLWNTSMLIVPDYKNLKWLTRLGELGFSLSTGSACSSGKGKPSHVLQAMGLDFEQMGRVLRISAGWHTASSDWKALAGAFVEVWQILNSKSLRKTRSTTISLSDINPLH